MRELLTLRRFCSPHKWRILCGIFFLILNNLTELVTPGILAYGTAAVALMYEEGVVDRDTLLAYGGILVGATLLRGLLSFIQRMLIVRTSRTIERDIRNELFTRLASLSPSFFTQAHTGDLIARATNDLNAVRAVLGMGIMYTIDSFNKFTGGLIILLFVDVKVTLLMLLPLLIAPVITRVFGGKIHKRFTDVQEQFSELNTRAQENFAGIRVIKSFAQETNEIDRFDRMTREYVDRNIHMAKLRSLLFPLVSSIAGLAIVISFTLSGTAAIRGLMTSQDFFMYVFYVPMLMWPMYVSGFLTLVLQSGAASMRRINQLLAEEPTIADAPDCIELERAGGAIEFRDFSFRYEEAAAPAVDRINLKIPAGSTLAIVGPTGSGKTTLAAAIPRLLEVEPGQVFVDGHDITTIGVRSLRRQVGYVPQDTFLFSETIRENIAFGFNGEAPEPSVEAAAQVSRLSNDVDQISRGYDARLGERGVNLSGGQKQRTAISRAVILDAPILILDDCLSAVDTHTEEEILKRIAHVMAQRTSIIISHRISAVKNADQIVVLSEGRIAEQGTHDTLLAAGGIYATIQRKQQLEEELETLT